MTCRLHIIRRGKYIFVFSSDQVEILIRPVGDATVNADDHAVEIKEVRLLGVHDAVAKAS